MSWTSMFKWAKLVHDMINLLYKVQLWLLSTFVAFFWSLSCAILVCKLYISIRIILDFWAVLIFEVFYGGIFQKINFNSWSFFRCFFWSVNFAGWAFLSQHIRILLLLAIFPDLEMAQFWSVNYICQVYKLKLLYWTCPKFWTIFILIGSYL